MNTSVSNAERAEILTQALPYIKQYVGKVVVIKYGGNAMIDETLKQQVMEDIALLWLIGVKVVLIHGGGPEISDMMKKLGKQPQFIDGLEEGFIKFLSNVKEGDLKAEYLLPSTIDELIKAGKATVKVLPTSDKWFGVTYKEDAPVVIDSIKKLVESGVYPEKLS